MNKKLISLALAVLMIVTMMASTVSLAAPTEEGEDPQTKNVTLHKILQDTKDLNAKKEEHKDIFGDETGEVFPGQKGLDGTKYVGKSLGNEDNIKAYFGEESKEISGVYFVWKVKQDDPDADPIYIKGKEGNKLAPDVADGKYVTTLDIDEAMGGLTGTNGIKFETDGLKGDFEIDEIHEKSTYYGTPDEVGKTPTLTRSKAVPVVITLPLVNEEGVVEDAHVYPKNTEDKPEIDKNFAKEKYGDYEAILKAIENKEIEEADLGAAYAKYQAAKKKISADIGSVIPYEVKTKIPAKTHYKHVIWSDTMTHGLTFNKDSLKIYYGDKNANPRVEFPAGNYDIVKTLSGFELSLNPDGLKAINDKETEKEFVLTYTATVNSTAVADNPDNNDITFQYGHKPKKNKESEPFKPTTTTLKVVKTWAEATVGAPVDTVFDLYERPEGGTDGDWKLVDSITIAKGNTTADRDFTGLATSGKEYKVVERPNGYIPTYTVDTATGKVTIDNTKDDDNPDPLNPTDPKVEVYGKKFVKTDDKGKDDPKLERLQGAEFVIRDGEGEDAKYLVRKSDTTLGGDTGAYENAQKAYLDAIKALEVELNKATPDPTTVSNLQEAVNTAKNTRDKAYKEMKYLYQWLTETEINESTESVKRVTLISDDQGRFEIEGLAKGTYYLEETKAPAKFAKLSGRIEFVVGPGSYDGSAEEIQYNKDDTNDGYGQQVTNKKVSIPQTGGIGTVIFTVVGLAIMTVAVTSLKKRSSEQ